MTIATKRTKTIVSVVTFVAIAVFVFFVAHARTQEDVTDADLEAVSEDRMVRVGPAAGSTGRIASLPLEAYVARVLAGEAEPRPGRKFQALAVATARSFANAGRHARDGFDPATGCTLVPGSDCRNPALRVPPPARSYVERRARRVLFGRGG
jgi:hypothetical protein